MSKRAKQLLKENNLLSKQLSAENAAILTDIVVYIRGTDISDYQQELVRRDITQMILEGECRGDSAQDVIGGDYRSFCDSVIAEIPRPSFGDKVFSIMGGICLSLAVLCTIWLFGNLLNIFFGKKYWPYLPVTAGEIIAAVFIIGAATGLFQLITRYSFDNAFLKGKKMFLIVFAVLFVNNCVVIFFRSVIFTVHAGAAAALIIALYLAYKVLDEKAD